MLFNSSLDPFELSSLVLLCSIVFFCALMSIDNDPGWRLNGLNVITPQTGDTCCCELRSRMFLSVARRKEKYYPHSQGTVMTKKESNLSNLYSTCHVF